jgi:hypothetical protein
MVNSKNNFKMCRNNYKVKSDVAEMSTVQPAAADW